MVQVVASLSLSLTKCLYGTQLDVLLSSGPLPPWPPQQSELLSLLHSLLSKGDHATAMAHIVAERGACLVAFAKAKQLKIRILIVQVCHQYLSGVHVCTYICIFLSARAICYNCILHRKFVVYVCTLVCVCVCERLCE